MKNILIAFLLVAAASCAAQTQQSAEQRQKKIVLIPGHDSHGVGEHEHLGGCQLLAKLLNEHVPGVTAVVTEQGWPKDTTILDNADAIVMYCDGGAGHMVIPHIAHIDQLMKKGTGLVNLHYAVEIPKGEYGNKFLEWLGGYFETHYSVNPFWTASFKKFPRHQLASGVEPFTAHDEWYYHMRFANDKNIIHVLKDLPPPESLRRPDGPHENNAAVREDVLNKKLPQTVAWGFTRKDGGRSFGFTGAHVHNNWKIDGFRKVVLNAVVWAAGLEVPKDGIVTPAPTGQELDALRKTRKDD